MSDKNTVAVVGAGLMGPGIAACAALAGRPVVLTDTTMACAEAGAERARVNIRQLLANGLAEPAQAEAAEGLIRPATGIGDHLGEIFLIVEAITERLAAKQALFEELDRLAPPDVIIASNTSGLQITKIAEFTEHTERTVTAHFWFPGHLVPLVEVVMGDKTAESVALALRDELRGWGKAPVIVRRDLPGQLANRILQAIIREATNIVAMGLASAEDVDTAIKMGMGLRFPAWGPLEHIDGVGLDLALRVQESVLPSLYNEPAPNEILRRLVDQGCLGYKTGQGFYDWHLKDMTALAAGRDRFIIEALKILQRTDET